MERGDFEKFLTAMGADRKCPACGQDDWQSMNAKVEGVQSVIPSSDGVGFFPVEVMVCGTCGFVRLHATQVVMRKTEIERRGELH